MTLSTKARFYLLASTAFLSAFAAQPARAEEDSRLDLQAEQAASAVSYPSFGGEVVMELQNEYTTESDDPDTDEHNNMFFRTEVAPVLYFNENFFIDGVAVFENIQDREPDEDNWFDNEGAFIEEIKLNYENGPWAAWAGKFNPGFGIAWDYGRGIWSEDFAEDYEITEKIGVGGSYTFENDQIGAHTLALNTFFADTTFLSGSTITKRDTLDEDDGGASNTEDFSSYVASLNGENIFGVENLYYKLGFRHLAEGDADVGTDDENGYEVTLGHVFNVTDRVSADALVEYVNISNFETGPDDAEYFTASVVTKLDDRWNVTLGYTARNFDVDGGDDVKDHLFQVSGGYDFGQGTTAEIGWRNSEEDGVDTDIVGGLIRHSFAF